MKNRWLFTIGLPILFSFLSFNVYSQRILGAVVAGMNLAQVDGDEIYGFHKAGFNIGPSAIIPFGKKKNWSVNLELLFSQKGSYQKIGPSDNTNAPKPYYKLRLDYVEVPVFVRFTDKNIISGGLGISYAQLVNAKEIEHDSTTPTNLQSPYTLGDLQILADVQFKIWQRLWFNLRYSYSIYPIRTRHYKVPVVGGYNEWNRKQYNNVITLRFIYVFNQELQNKKGRSK